MLWPRRNSSIMQTSAAKSKLSYMNNTITSSNRNLADRALSLQDSTVCVVVTLVIMASVLCDNASAKAYLMLLQQIILLRGGLKGLLHDPVLHVEDRSVNLLHFDLRQFLIVLAAENCTQRRPCLISRSESPLLFTDTISWDPLFGDVRPVHTVGRVDPAMYGIEDERVFTIFRDLQYYTRISNDASSTKQRIPTMEYQDDI
ncbi:hypothetical protein BJ170DRAFT_477517 [Xylariales sp. AK1849]|nr:hypothetical protein BJ170DRAFT_477517 [Xylariales sp. AK1849]